MSTIAPAQAARGSQPQAGYVAVRERERGDAARVAASARRGGRPLFSITFACAMGDADIARLVRMLNLDTNMHPKLHDSPVSPGVVRLDFYSGLFLHRGEEEGHWTLEGRTWGNPPEQTVHEWLLRAATAAHQLDSTVTCPPGSQPPRAST